MAQQVLSITPACAKSLAEKCCALSSSTSIRKRRKKFRKFLVILRYSWFLSITRLQSIGVCSSKCNTASQIGRNGSAIGMCFTSCQTTTDSQGACTRTREGISHDEKGPAHTRRAFSNLAPRLSFQSEPSRRVPLRFVAEGSHSRSTIVAQSSRASMRRE